MSPDILVIGGGLIGASTAWRLRQSGLRVTLIEAGRLGRQASWAGAGMLAPGGEVEQRSQWTDLALKSLRLYPSFVRELEETTGIEIDFQGEGAIELAFSEAEWAALRRRARFQRELGIPSEIIRRHDWEHLAPPSGLEVTGALYYPEDALVDPRHLMAALERACRQSGVTVREGVSIRSLAAGPDSVEAASGQERFQAGVAVVAAGAWSSQIAGVALPPVDPVRGHLLGYALPCKSLGPILRHQHTYLLQRTSGYLIAGTSEEEVDFDSSVDPDTVADIRRRAEQILPLLADAGEPNAWVGFRPKARQGAPHIERWEMSNVWLAYGHYRNGILLAPATADIVTEQIKSLLGAR